MLRLVRRSRFSTFGGENPFVNSIRDRVAAGSIRNEDVRFLVSEVGSAKEARAWMEHYTSGEHQVAVIKVGGAVLGDESELEQLSVSLAFLSKVGLFPIVVHGAGPQWH